MELYGLREGPVFRAISMKHSQDEINKYFEDTRNGIYKDNSESCKPKIIADDESEQCISIPSNYCTERHRYCRTPPNGIWKPMP